MYIIYEDVDNKNRLKATFAVYPVTVRECIRVNVLSWDGYYQLDDSEISLRKTDCISVHFTDCFRWPDLMPSVGHYPGANKDFLARGH